MRFTVSEGDASAAHAPYERRLPTAPPRCVRAAQILGATLPLAAGLLLASCDDSDPAALEDDDAVTVVTFPDSLVEAAVRTALDRHAGPVLRSDVEERLTGIALSASAGNRERLVESLAGLEYALNLRSIRIGPDSHQPARVAPLSSLTPLNGLRRLSSLEMRNPTRIADLEPLRDLVALADLVVLGSEAGDISPLAGLTRLVRLTVTESRISDLAALAGLRELRDLYLAGNRIEDITPIGGLSELTALDLEGNRVTDISPLRGLSRLRFIDLRDNRIEDIGPLVEIPLTGSSQHRRIHLSGNPLSRQALCEDVPALLEKAELATGRVLVEDVADIPPCPADGG